VAAQRQRYPITGPTVITAVGSTRSASKHQKRRSNFKSHPQQRISRPLGRKRQERKKKKKKKKKQKHSKTTQSAHKRRHHRMMMMMMRRHGWQRPLHSLQVKFLSNTFNFWVSIFVYDDFQALKLKFMFLPLS
jgi:putative cell wall-binding protein